MMSRQKWTQIEIDAVKEGALIFGPEIWNRWKCIKNKFAEELKGRSNVQVKDCFRTLQKKKANQHNIYYKKNHKFVSNNDRVIKNVASNQMENYDINAFDLLESSDDNEEEEEREINDRKHDGVEYVHLIKD